MGFISAVRDIGRHRIEEAEFYRDLDLRLLQLPLMPSFDSDRGQDAILVGLKMEDPLDSVLHIEGVDKVELRAYWTEGLTFDEQKRRYCFKEPAGGNVTWGFSPVYRLGRPKKNSVKDLLGSNGRLARLRRTVLDDYERSGVFSEGSVDLIIEELTNRAEELADLWSDSKRDYILVFGVFHGGRFLYPGDVPAFVHYYKNKIKSQIYDSSFPGFCSVCHTHSEQCVNLDQVFAFATFDKPGFLPGTRGTANARSKVFPICLACFSELNLGREYLDTHFCDRRTIWGINIYVAPELLFDLRSPMSLNDAFRDFIRVGLRREESLFRSLARRDEALVYHFVFWEAQQAQERIHLMVEDVPPSHLKQLERVWTETAKVFELEDERKTLDYALGEVVRVIRSFAGESEQDQKAMQMYAISVIGKLLNNEPVDVKTIKTLAVSRLPGLVHDDKWLDYGSANAQRLAAIVDFLNRCARRG